MSFAYIRHEDIDQPFKLRITKFLDPNRSLDIYDDPESPLSSILITVRLTRNKTVIFESTEGLIQLPQDPLQVCFDFPFLVQDIPQETCISILI